MKKTLIKLGNAVTVVGVGMLTPFAAFAQNTQTGTNANVACQAGTTVSTIQTFICKLNDILSAIVPFLVALGIVYFVWGVVSYVIADDEEAKSTGRSRMIYGIIGLVVIVGVWGLVYWITNTFGLTNTQTIQYPTVPY